MVKQRARQLIGRPAKQGWRALRPHLPPTLAENIRVPLKRVLRRAGFVS